MKSTAFHFQPGDVLYGRLHPYLNKVLSATFEGLCSSEFIVLPASQAIESKYLSYYLSNSEFVMFANQLNQGDRPRVSFDQISEHILPLPPLKEQRRVILRLDELLSKVDGCKVRLERIPGILKRFRQSVLAAASSGRLTADWREQNLHVQVSPVLRQRITKSAALDVPTSWLGCSVGDVMVLKGGYAFKSTDYSERGVPLVRISNIQSGIVTLENAVKIPDEKANWNFAVEPGDLLVAMSGA